ncbi:MAG: hypothetical protein ACE5DN_01165 [Flavobacteriales bacterium]
MEALLCTFYIALFVLLIFRMRFFRSTDIHPFTLTGIFLLKISFGLLLWYIYTYHYPDRSAADIYKYFDDSKVMLDALWDRPGDFFRMLFGIGCGADYFRTHYFDVMNHWYRPQTSNLFNDNHTIIRFNAIARIFSFGYFNVHTIFMNFFSFTGLIALYKALAGYFKGKTCVLFAVIFLAPSVLFWGSGVLKEGLLLFALGFLVSKWMMLANGKPGWWDALVLLLSFGLLLILKFYIIMCMLPGMSAWLWVEKTGRHHALIKYIITCTLAVVCALNVHHINPDLNVLETLVKKQRWFLGLVRHEQSGSAFQMDVLEPTFTGFLKAAPTALLNTFARPYVWEGGNVLSVLAGMENLLMLCFMAWCILSMGKPAPPQFNLFAMLLTYVVLLYLLIGWITPVAGAIVRYRVPGIPFLLAAFLLMADRRKIYNLWRKRQ